MGAQQRNGFHQVRSEWPRLPCQLWPDAGKLVVITDVIDGSRALVFGPTSGVARQILTYKRLSLTDLVIPDVNRGARRGTVEKAWAAFDTDAKWAATSWGKKMAVRKSKTSANDFERFQAMVAKKKINSAARAALA